MAYSQYFGKASQLLSNASLTDVVPPTYSGITSVVANADGSATVSSGLATDLSNPIEYGVYVAAGSVSAATLFTSGNLSRWSPTNTIRLYADASNNPLTAQLYTFGMRAKDAVGNINTNTAILTATLAGVPSNSVTNLLNQLIATVGTPAGATVSADIAQVETNVVSILNGINAQIDVLTHIEVPDSGSKTYPLRIRFVNNKGVNVDPDSNAISISIVDTGGSTVLAATSMTRVSTGSYRYDYVVNSADALRVLIVQFDFTYLTVALVRRALTETVDIEKSTHKIAATIGTPAGSTVSADIASVKSDTNSLRTDYTTARAAKIDNLDVAVSSRVATADSRLDNLDATVSSRATATAVAAIPTTPQLASVALTQYNALTSAVGSISNSTNFSGIVPQIMDQVYGATTETYTFYANTFNSSGSPVDPDSNILNFTVDDNQGSTLQPITAMTRNGVGAYTGTFTVTSAMVETDIVVFFAYSIASVAFQQIRTSKILSIANDSANIAAIKAKTDNLPVDPASNTVVSTRASQASVNVIPTNPLLTDDARLNRIDTTISSRATQTSVNTIPTNPLLTNDSRIDPIANLDTTVSSRASQISVNAIPTNPLLTDDTRLNRIDTTISSRASQSSLDADFGNTSNLINNIITVEAALSTDATNIATTEVALAADAANIAATEALLTADLADITAASSDVVAAAATIATATAGLVAAESSLTTTAAQLETDINTMTVLVGELGAISGNYTANMSVGINSSTDTGEFLSWLTVNGSLIVDPDYSTLQILDGDGVVAADLGMDNTHTGNGVFKFVLTTVSASLNYKVAYTAKVLIHRDGVNYVTLIPFSLGTIVIGGTAAPGPAPVFVQPTDERALGFPQNFGVRAVYDGTINSALGS